MAPRMANTLLLLLLLTLSAGPRGGWAWSVGRHHNTRLRATADNNNDAGDAPRQRQRQTEALLPVQDLLGATPSLKLLANDTTTRASTAGTINGGGPTEDAAGDASTTPPTLLQQLQRFIGVEFERESVLRESTQRFINDEFQREQQLRASAERFIRRELERESALRESTQRFINDEFEREQQLRASAEAFVRREFEREENVRTNAIKVERAAAQAASKFIAGELQRATPELVVCTDGLACGPSGSARLLESAAALAAGAGSPMNVRRGKCESVCPRDGGIVVRVTSEDDLRVWTTTMATAAPAAPATAAAAAGDHAVQATTPTPAQLARDPEETKAVSWAPLALRVVEAECGVTVPPSLVHALQSKALGDVRLWRGELAAAAELFTEAIDRAPDALLADLAVPLVSGAGVPLPRQQLGWAGSVWWQTHTESTLVLPPREYFDSFFELGDYAGPGGLRGSLSFLRETADGVLLGSWAETQPGGGTQRGTFRLALNAHGTAFTGQRWDSSGVLLGVWDGHRVSAPGPASAPAPDAVAWLHGALHGRARVRQLQLQGHDAAEDAAAWQAVASDAAGAVAVWPQSLDGWVTFCEAAEELLKHDRAHLDTVVAAYEQLLFLQPLAPTVTTDDGEDLASTFAHGRAAAGRVQNEWAANPALAREARQYHRRLAELRAERAKDVRDWASGSGVGSLRR